MEDKRKQFLSVLNARAKESRDNAKPMNPIFQRLIERAKANGIQPRPTQKISREELMERLRNRIKK